MMYGGIVIGRCKKVLVGGVEKELERINLYFQCDFNCTIK
jgi:hypothetical protein